MKPLAVVAAVSLFVAAAVGAQDKPIAVKPEQIKWSDMQGMAGWKMAVLAGDPTKAGPYVERVKLPANAFIPPHSHPDTENLTVISGTFSIGNGDKADKSKTVALSAGSFYLLPANLVHYAWTGPKGATIQIHGVGPSGMTIVAADKKPAAKPAEAKPMEPKPMEPKPADKK